jgi:hypothetical protein
MLSQTCLGWRGALKLAPPRLMLMTALVVAGVLVQALPPLSAGDRRTAGARG